MSGCTVAAIDLGASSGRVLRGTLDGGRLAVEECSRFPNGVAFVRTAGQPDLVWDVLSLWRGIREGLAEATRRGPVEAIGIDTWGVDYGLLDADGRLIGNPAAYRSPRTADAVVRVHGLMPQSELYGFNGAQHQAFNTLFQLVADRSAAQAELARSALLIPDLIAYWLTGRRVCEVTNASTTGLIDPATRDWSPELLDLLNGSFGVPVPDLLAELVEPGTVIGPMDLPDISVRTSENRSTPVVAVATHDTASAIVGVPAPGRSGRFGFVSSGTWSLVGVELDHPVKTDASAAANFTNELGADGTVRYLKNIMGTWMLQETLRQWREEDGTEISWPQACRMAASAPSMRTLIESLAVAYRRALREARELSGASLETVNIVGGGGQNELLCRLTADATGLPVVAGPVEGTSMGNMVVALRAVGAIDGGLDEMRQVVADSTSTTRYEPGPDQESIWEAAEARVFSPAPAATAAT